MYCECFGAAETLLSSSGLRATIEAILMMSPLERSHARGSIDVQEASLTRASRPLKRGRKVGKTKRGKGSKIIAVADRHGLPISVCVASATPHEVTLATS